MIVWSNRGPPFSGDPNGEVVPHHDVMSCACFDKFCTSQPFVEPSRRRYEPASTRDRAIRKRMRANRTPNTTPRQYRPVRHVQVKRCYGRAIQLQCESARIAVWSWRRGVLTAGSGQQLVPILDIALCREDSSRFVVHHGSVLSKNPTNYTSRRCFLSCQPHTELRRQTMLDDIVSHQNDSRRRCGTRRCFTLAHTAWAQPKRIRWLAFVFGDVALNAWRVNALLPVQQALHVFFSIDHDLGGAGVQVLENSMTHCNKRKRRQTNTHQQSRHGSRMKVCNRSSTRAHPP